MRMCLRCGCVAYINYAYQVIVCGRCGKAWGIEDYEREREFLERLLIEEDEKK